MKKLITFYDDIFQYHYNRAKKKESDPEVMPIAIISFTQSANILLVFIVFFYLFNLKEVIKIQYVVIGLYVSALAINFIIYSLNDRKEDILKREKQLPKKFNRVAWAYLLVSLWLPLFLIYMFNEVWKVN